MLRQPFLHGRMFVRGVVVSDQMKRLVLGRFAVDLAQEFEPLAVSVAPLLWLMSRALTDEREETTLQKRPGGTSSG
jgi:hypothetical protein